MTLLVLILGFMSALDVYYTCSGIMNGDIVEVNPMSAWLFKMPVNTWLPVIILTNFISLIIIGLNVVRADIPIVRMTMYAIILIRFVGSQTGFVATVQHIKHTREKQCGI